MWPTRVGIHLGGVPARDHTCCQRRVVKSQSTQRTQHQTANSILETPTVAGTTRICLTGVLRDVVLLMASLQQDTVTKPYRCVVEIKMKVWIEESVEHC